MLLEEVTGLVDDELRDPSFGEVVLRALELSIDCKVARVHFMLRGPDIPGRRERQARAFLRAAPMLRARLAELVELKRVPELRFVFQGFVAIGEDREDER